MRQGFTLSLAQELKGTGVTVQEVQMLIKTNLSAKINHKFLLDLKVSRKHPKQFAQVDPGHVVTGLTESVVPATPFPSPATFANAALDTLGHTNHTCGW